ncbi:uncharacterized protein LOC8054829 isoform X3 [Sorghum bicolor]|uniref:UBA domain-containing protein n=1 Tax=Sorghum bicolor TaxID=4558 RepID=A0A1Z5RAB3_SORBI|nr:uncharacterized protein LOC8054829 isoform X3 [Sorghum bicolor]OQU80692.1 hypothetical protein SORBI_3007G164101 [Sorghum bicolor]|eukprot:XP_021320989.1 uncharacterized protein LOC8054829 isoform X3 [Sorghum bicolor]
MSCLLNSQNSSGETSGAGTRASMERVKHENFCRAVAEDNTALLLLAVGNSRKEALCRIRKGSDASRVLDPEMSARLLHLACKHDAVECARLLLEGGSGIAAAPIDARDQLTWTPLHVAAETHSTRCIELLLSKNARTDLRVVDGRPLLPLEIALMSRRVQTKWSVDNSIEDLLSFLKQMDLNAVRLLAEETRVVGELAYRYAMEGSVPALAMLLLVVEEKISPQVSVVIQGVSTKRSIYNSIVDEALSMGDASARDGNERRKALLCEIQLLNQFGSASWRDHNDRRTLPPLLRAAKVGDMNVIKMLLMGNVDVNEADSEGNTALHWCLSGASYTKEPRIVWLLLKNGARVFQWNKLGLTPVHSAAAKGNYKALQSLLLHAQDCVDIPTKTKETPLFFAVNNGFVDCAKLLLCFGADTKARNLRKQRPIDVATSQDMRFILSSANVLPWNHSSPQQNRVMRKKIYKELLGDKFDDHDKDYCDDNYTGFKTSVGQYDFRSSNHSAQGLKSKSQYVPKQAQGSKFVPRAKASSSGASTATAAKVPATPGHPAAPVVPATSVARTPTQAPVATAETAPPSAQPQAAPAATLAASGDADVYSQAASNLVSGNNLEQIIQQILDMGGGTWERDTVVRALRAAYNNPERAIDYLYSGIPVNVETPPVAGAPAGGQQTNQQAPSPAQPAVASPVQPSAASARPDANPLILFPQVNLHFCGRKIRTSLLPGLSIVKLVQLALLENNIRTTDFYLLLNGRLLDEHVTVNDIPAESNIQVRPRVRGGVDEVHETTYRSIDTVINKRGHEKMFRRVIIPKQLGKRYACLLSPFSQYILFGILRCVCREAHQFGKCYNGAFTLADFMISKKGHIKMSSSVFLDNYTPQGGEADYRQLYRILLVFVDAERGLVPLYFAHLLDTLRSTNELNRRDPDSITFLLNHPSLLTYAERHRLFCLIDQMILKLPREEKEKVFKKVNSIPGYSKWDSNFEVMKEFNRVYNFPSGKGIHRYAGSGLNTTIHFCRNYLSHPEDWVSILFAEVAISLLVEDMLAKVIKELLDYQPPVYVGTWDLIGLIANVRADTGTMLNQDGAAYSD